jgi:FkbM family methyltransferase
VHLDIGAHIGDTSAGMATLADKVISFDPNPENVGKALMALADINPKIDAWSVGVSDKNGTIQFEYGGLCNGGIAGFGGGGAKHILPVVALQPFLMDKYGADIMKQITFIKTDLEGFDATLIRALVPMITDICRTKCPIIQVEWWVHPALDRVCVLLYERHA